MDFSGFDKPSFGSISAGMTRNNPAGSAPPKKKKNFWLDQLSTVGGIAGGVAGTVVAPVFGTAAGGAIGSGLGEALENAISGQRVMDNVGKEAALGGIFSAGPLRLGKAAMGTGAALRAAEGIGLKEALQIGAKEGAEFSLRGEIGKKVLQGGEKAVAKQFRLTPSQLYNFKNKTGEDAVKVLQRYGINSAEDVTAKGIQPLQSAFDEVAGQIPNISKKNLAASLKKSYQPLMNSAVIPEQQLGQQLKAQADEILAQSGNDVPASVVNDLRKRFDSFVSYTQRGTPDHNAVKMTADTLRKTMQSAADKAGLGHQGKTFKEIGRDLQKLYDLDEIVAKQANLGRGSSPVGMLNLLGAGAGGAGGGPVGMAAGYLGTKALNSPTSRKAIAIGSEKLGSKLLQSGAKSAARSMNPLSIAGRVGTAGVATGIAGQSQPTSAQGSLEDALMNFQDQSSGANMTPNMPTAAPMSNPINSFSMGQGYQNPQQMSTAEQSGNPYSRENLLSDIQRDPKNAQKYIQYYQQLDEIFSPKMPDPVKFSNTAIQSMTDLETGLDNLGSLEGRIGQSSANAPIIGALRSKNPFDTEAKTLRAEIDRVKQVVGKALEGGVLRKEDEEKYKRILPTINDTDEVAMQKIAAIRSDLQNKLQTFYQNQQQFSGNPSLTDALMQQQGAF